MVCLMPLFVAGDRQGSERGIHRGLGCACQTDGAEGGVADHLHRGRFRLYGVEPHECGQGRGHVAAAGGLPITRQDLHRSLPGETGQPAIDRSIISCFF